MATVQRALRDGDLFAPAILHFELANICWKKMRKNPQAASPLRQQFGVGMAVPITIVDVEFIGIVALAERTGLSGYDASYLWLAQSMTAELLTLDEKLRRVAAGAV